MKRILAILTMIVAFAGTALAWEPVIKETHWFGVYEYEDYYGNFLKKDITWIGNYLESTEITKEWTGQTPQQAPKVSFYSWLDHKLRFRVDNTGDWELDMNSNSAYNRGIGLKNHASEAKNFYVDNLNSGDQVYIRYYLDGGNSATEITESAGGSTHTFSIPSNAVIRCVFITLTEYEKAETSVRPLTSDELNYYGKPNDFGYRYSFSSPGVLEDKQGAVPYITMQFGSDNDMAFVRALADVNYTYGDYKHVVPKIFVKENGASDGTDATPNEDGIYVVHSINNPAFSWDTQFWIGTTEYSLPVGQKFKIKFDYMAEKAATVNTQTHSGHAGPYIHWACIGDVNFTTNWQTFEQEITISNDMAGWMSVAFNLNPGGANTYYFRNIELQIPERTADTSEQDFGVASVIDANNNFNPDVHQYHIKYKIDPDPNNQYPQVRGTRTEDDLKNMFIGKEWSVFTAPHAPDAPYVSGGTYVQYNGQSEEVVWRDIFRQIFPLCGNFFYFFPEVDGKLIVEYYCEGSNETPAFWFKTDAEGNQMTVSEQGQMNCVHHNVNGASRTSGNNNYWLEADVSRGCVYYFCSLPTNNQHEHPVIRVKSYSFIPKFRVEPLTLVVNNTTDIDDSNSNNKITHAAEIFGGPYNQLLDVNGTFDRNHETLNNVRYFGNVKSADIEIQTVNNKQQFLNFSNIQFKEGANPGGAIVVHLSDACGEANFVLTVAYDAVEAKWGVENGKDKRIQESGTKEVKHWDFYSNTNWDLGKYSDTGSNLYKEIHKDADKTADWNNTYVNLPDSKEPIFKSVYDIEADNVDMIHETEGLVIRAHSNMVGIYNENPDPTSSFQDRYIGFMPGSKLVIPRLKANDRVVIKMGTYGNADETISAEPITLTINNAKDAMGTLIEDDYVIGGSAEDTDATTKDKTLPHGEYHFIVDKTSDSDDNDFSIEVKDGELLKIYSVVIYRNAVEDGENIPFADQVILTENQVMGDDNKRYLLVTEETNEDDYALMYLNYRGLDEPTIFHQDKRMTGNVVLSGSDKNISISSGHANDDPNNAWLNFAAYRPDSPENATFGIIKTRMGVETKDKEYVTDYAECMIPVGYRQLMEYPYTWDFTDLKAKYISDGIDENGVEKDVDEDDLKIWDGYKFRGAPETYDGYIFSPGGQLYGGTKMFDETRGIGIVHKGENEAMSLTDPNAQGGKGDGGLAVVDGQTLEFVVPQVPVNGAVYVHARKVANASNAKLQSRIKTKAATAYTDAADFTFVGTDSNGDDVFAIKNNDRHEAYINLSVQGYEVNKIAVATDEKSLNKKGYASESRDHAIDAKLLPYFTGKPLRTYTVTGFKQNAMTVDLNDVALTNNYVVPANTGVVIFNDDTKVPTTDDPVGDLQTQFGPFDGGFHLFVPDMHDQTGKEASLDGNLMVAALDGCDPVPYTNGDEDPNKNTTNYVLSFKYKKLNGNNLSTTIEGPEKFYRVYSGNPVKLKANSSYLQLPTKLVAPGGNVNAPSRVSFRHNNFLRGDVNSDLMVDVADFTGIANHILGRTSETFVERAADVNDDDMIDVADFTGVANIILGLGKGTNRAQMVTDDDNQGDMLYVEPFEAVPGTQQVIAVRMTNYIPATGYEFTLTLPEGMTFATDADGVMARLSTARTSERKTNFFGSALQADGSLKVLCGTSRGDDYGLFTFDGADGEVALITVNIPADYEHAQYTATVSDGKYSDMFGLSHYFGATTGISDIAVTFDAEPDTYYTLSGQKLNGRPTQRGFYILNGKKVMVK